MRLTYDKLEPADVVLVKLPSHKPKGHEQESLRPAVVVGIPTGELRYPVVLIVPLTTRIGSWSQNNPAVYPRLEPGAGNLSRSSVALLDQIRGLDLQRLSEYLGTLSKDDYAPIKDGLAGIVK